MKIKHLEIKNFRLLKNIKVDLEDNLSLVIGRNNSGKTSLLSVLDKFLNNQSFSFDDFNLDFQKKLSEAVATEVTKENYKPDEYNISLKIEIEYTQEDSLKNIRHLILDLNQDNQKLILFFEYGLSYENYKRLITEFGIYKEKNEKASIFYFLGKNHNHFFSISKKTVESENPENNEPLEDKDILKIINFQVIEAKRDVSNGDKKENKALSRLSSKYYKARNAKSNKEVSDVSDLQKQILETDEQLTTTYKEFFKPVIQSIKRFSSIPHDSVLEIISTLKELNLFEENTTVKYNQDGHNLPEGYNGLGYMNLFAIIFDIHIKLDEFKKVHSDTDSPADINLLFIEEPEAHTHPQMQYIFIKNIKTMLHDETKDKLKLQTIITTHSSHIHFPVATP